MQRGLESAEGRLPASAQWSRLATIELTVLAILVLAVRFVDLGHPPFIDEMNHVLAASSLLSDGSLTIHDGGSYERGALFTYLVAGAFALFGQSLAVARLPAVISGVLLVCLLFAWVRTEAGRIAAWTAGLLLGFAPIAIYLSQWVRFYMLHALLFWIGAWAVYRIVDRADPGPRRLAVAGVGLLALLGAFHLQVTTVVGVTGLGLFAALIEGPRLLGAIASRQRRIVLLVGLAAVIVVTFAALQLLGVVEWLGYRAVLVDSWAIDRVNDFRFYQYLLTDQYVFLWSLFPLAGLIALSRRWRLALLFLSVFGVAVVAHSIAAWKAERYLFYVMPALFAVWGLAAGEALPWLWHRLDEGGRRELGRLPRWWRHAIVAGAIALGLAFATTGIPAYTTTRLIFLQGREWKPPPGHRGELYRGHADWEAVAPRLRTLADSVDVVIGAPDMIVVYFVGDVDYVLSVQGLVRNARIAGPHDLYPEFSVDRKIGRPMMATAASVELLMSCYATGMIVVESHVWGWRGGVPRETADFIEANARPVDLTDGTGVRAYRWHTTAVEETPRCDAARRARREAPVTPGP